MQSFITPKTTGATAGTAHKPRQTRKKVWQVRHDEDKRRWRYLPRTYRESLVTIA